ncbi:MAG: hypothetical protein JO316_22195 [Abitibacteriaceae bacterium]|nr:hypothetical protein [Abditibacteriaceae bacterium]
MLLISCLAISAQAAPRLPYRVFSQSQAPVDSILARPYNSEVPFGASGERVWATSPQGWAFRSGVQLIYMTNLNAFDVVVSGNGVRYGVAKADYMPSHVHMVGAPAHEEMTASAAFTYATDRVENPLTKPFKPEKRWTCWNSGHREDWYTVDFGRSRQLTGLDLYFFDDQPHGGCAPPEAVTVELFRNGQWTKTEIQPLTPKAGLNTISWADNQPQAASQVRLTFRNRGEKLYTGLYGFDPHFAATDALAPQIAQAPLSVSGDKWITADDVLVSRLTVTNHTREVQPFSIRMDSPLKNTPEGLIGQQDVQGFPFYLAANGTDGSGFSTNFTKSLRPHHSRTFTFACAIATQAQDAKAILQKTLLDADPLRTQVAAYQGWFDDNTAYFQCSDPFVSKMYYHRWYNVKKNSMNPRLGKLQHRTFAEGRWTSDWYANVISYGAGHQICEARWLRDPSYAWGHLQTWTDNSRPDGIYPGHITLKGQQGGQYTDWISATAWDANLVHPDRNILARVADTLAHNAEGWRKVYGWNNSPLLVVDSHWWTGMEWQPSFFSFADYHTTKPEDETHLRRVDLTAYNYGNEQAVANIYRELGRTQDAVRFQQLADETREAMLARMWNADTHWFHSLRATDNAKAPAKEIIGLYPFYFNLPPANKGYEAAWSVALDPKLFWTKWPLASAAQDCPAYSQTGWPIGPGGSICMWNGPSWPHANSIVMTAMANTLRHYAPCALTRQKLLELFNSFTRAQYKNGDLRYPWTGEYYNGDTGEWKTTQRDYNHSTWIDPLISDLIGVVPRADNILEIDPLLPPGAWSYYVLDGQAYRGHDITIAYDALGGRVARRFKGYAIYLDGKRIYHSDHPTHVLYDMEHHALTTSALPFFDSTQRQNEDRK